MQVHRFSTAFSLFLLVLALSSPLLVQSKFTWIDEEFYRYSERCVFNDNVTHQLTTASSRLACAEMCSDHENCNHFNWLDQVISIKYCNHSKSVDWIHLILFRSYRDVRWNTSRPRTTPSTPINMKVWQRWMQQVCAVIWSPIGRLKIQQHSVKLNGPTIANSIRCKRSNGFPVRNNNAEAFVNRILVAIISLGRKSIRFFSWQMKLNITFELAVNFSICEWTEGDLYSSKWRSISRWRSLPTEISLWHRQTTD